MDNFQVTQLVIMGCLTYIWLCIFFDEPSIVSIICDIWEQQKQSKEIDEDLENIGKMFVREWITASPEQRKEFVELIASTGITVDEAAKRLSIFERDKHGTGH